MDLCSLGREGKQESTTLQSSGLLQILCMCMNKHKVGQILSSFFFCQPSVISETRYAATVITHATSLFKIHHSGVLEVEAETREEKGAVEGQK